MSESTCRVLVVDDEESIRSFLQRVLEYAGYETIVASSASEAIELFTDRGGCDLLLTDLIMPHKARNKVVLPAPLAPNTVVMPPSATSSPTSCSTGVEP